MSPGNSGSDVLTRPVMHLAVDVARDVDILLVGARREAAGRGDRLLHGHAGHVGVLAGGTHFAHHEDRPVAVDLDRDVGIAQIAVAQLAGNRALEFLHVRTARRHRADQRKGDVAGLVDAIGVGQAFLLEHRHPHPVAGAEPVGLGHRLVEGGRGRTIAGAACHQHDCKHRMKQTKQALFHRTDTLGLAAGHFPGVLRIGPVIILLGLMVGKAPTADAPLQKYLPDSAQAVSRSVVVNQGKQNVTGLLTAELP